MKIHIGEFAKKGIFKDGFQLTPESLIDLIQVNKDKARQGYRDGCLMVSLPIEGFSCPIVQLKGGEWLIGRYRPRPGIKENPRKQFTVLADKTLPVKSVDAVLYHKDIAEDIPEGFDYELITILVKAIEGEQPMPVDTLLHNHFNASGGTPTNMNDAEFIAALKASFEFWKDKAIIQR